MTPAQFIASLGPWAKWCAKQPGVGLFPSVILAQWALETGWGSSEAWIHGHNPAGISGGGHPLAYPGVQAGMDAYVETIRLSYYDAVREARAKGAEAQARALGASPWDAGHYGGADAPGSVLVTIMQEQHLEQQLDGVEAPTTAPAVPPKSPVPTPGPIIPPQAWQGQVPAQWRFLEAVWSLSDAWYAVVNRHPSSPQEWAQIAHWAISIAASEATLPATLVEMSQQFSSIKLKLA